MINKNKDDELMAAVSEIEEEEESYLESFSDMILFGEELNTPTGEEE